MNRQALKVILAQSLITILLYAGLVVAGDEVAQSAFIGGAIATIANLVFAIGVFGQYSPGQTDIMMGRMYVAELVKLILVGALFAVTFVFIEPLNGLALFGGFFAVQMVPAFVPLGRSSG